MVLDSGDSSTLVLTYLRTGYHLISNLRPQIRSVNRSNCCWFCQHTNSWLQSPRDQETTYLFSSQSSQSQCYVTTDGQSASLSWCQAPVWGQRADFYYSWTFPGLLMWGALSDDKTDVSFTLAADPCQCSRYEVGLMSILSRV
jgi:hypothetical protein